MLARLAAKDNMDEVLRTVNGATRISIHNMGYKETTDQKLIMAHILQIKRSKPNSKKIATVPQSMKSHKIELPYDRLILCQDVKKGGLLHYNEVSEGIIYLGETPCI